jgi:predicted DNA-binding transcriptional regulator AlpA
MNNDVRVPKLLRVRDLVKATGIEAWRWYEIFARGEGPAYIRIGKTIRVSDAALVEWLKAREQQSNQKEE